MQIHTVIMLITWRNYDLNFSPQKSRMLRSAMPSNSGLSVSEIITSVFHEAVICVLLLQSFGGNFHVKHLQLLNNPSIHPCGSHALVRGETEDSVQGC